MRAKVVHEPGMKPNCAGSMADSTTGFNALSMTKPSATFDRVDVSEIGLRSLLMSLTVGALGRGGYFPISIYYIGTYLYVWHQ